MPIKVHDIVPQFISEKRNNERPIFSSLYYPDSNISVKEPEEFLAAYSQAQTPLDEKQKTNILQAFYGGNNERNHRNYKFYLTARGEEGKLNLPDLTNSSAGNTNSGRGNGNNKDHSDSNDNSNTNVVPATEKINNYEINDINNVHAGLLNEKTKLGIWWLAYLNVTNGENVKKKKKKKSRKLLKKSKNQENQENQKNQKNLENLEEDKILKIEHLENNMFIYYRWQNYKN